MADFADQPLSNIAFNFQQQEIFYTWTRKLEAGPKQKAWSSKILSGLLSSNDKSASMDDCILLTSCFHLLDLREKKYNKSWN